MENTEAHLPVTTSSLVIISFSQQPGENRFKVINDSPTYQQPVFTFRSPWFQSPSTSCWIRRKVFLWLGSVQSLSHVQLFATPWTAAHQASVFITNSRSLPKLMSIELVLPSIHLILCGPLLLLSIFPSTRVFSVSQLSASGGQSIGVSASTSDLPVNTQDWFPLGWTGWISLQSKGLSRVFSNTTVQKHQFFSAQFSL